MSYMQRTPASSVWIKAAALIGLFGLIVRLGFVFLYGSEQKIYDPNQDQYIYVDLAKNLVSGQGYVLSFDMFVASAYKPTAIQPPTYPLFIAVVFATFGKSLVAVRVVQAIIGALTCIAVLYIAGLGVNYSVGFVSGLVMACYPLSVMYVRPLMTETLFAFLLALVVLMLVLIITWGSRPSLYLGLGLLIAVTFLTRPESMLYLPLAGVVLLVPLIRKQQRVVGLLTGVGLTVIAFTVTVSPWVYYNWQAQGEAQLLPNKRWGNWESNWLRYQRENNPNWTSICPDDELKCSVPNFDQLSELERDKYTVQLMSDFVRQHPGAALHYALTRVLMSYPVIPREMLPPPLGYNGERDRPTDGLDITALDDFPFYFNPIEKGRVWYFRTLLLLSAVGLVLALKQRQWFLLLPAGMIGTNIASAFLLQGRERYRMPIDPYLIIVAVFALITLVAMFRRHQHQVHSLDMPLNSVQSE